MKNQRLKPLLGGFIYMAILALFTMPSTSVLELAPTVGGNAFADCGGGSYMDAAPQDSDCDGSPDYIDPCPYDSSDSCNNPPPGNTCNTLSLALGVWGGMVGTSAIVIGLFGGPGGVALGAGMGIAAGVAGIASVGLGFAASAGLCD